MTKVLWWLMVATTIIRCMTEPTTQQLLQHDRAPRTRYQRGSVFEKCGRFFVRYYTSQLVAGKLERQRVSEPLCQKDKQHPTANSRSVKALAQARMAQINAEQAAQSSRPTATDVNAFFETVYLPWVEKNKRESTVRGYKKLWAAELEKHFVGRALESYRKVDALLFLESLVPRLNKTSFNHVRWLASGVFNRAQSLGLIGRNPWDKYSIDKSELPKLREPVEVEPYSPKEVHGLIGVCGDRVDWALFVALSSIFGMRPSEICGLRWEDFTKTEMHVERRALRGVVGPLKTENSERTITLVEPVTSLLAKWRARCGGVTQGWVFTDRAGGAARYESIEHGLTPLARKAGIRWRGLYAGRHHAATEILSLTGDASAAAQVLGNRVGTIIARYVHPVREKGTAGLKQLERQQRQLQRKKH